MNAPEESTAKPPLVREIRKPYYLWRTPDNLGHYIKRENYRALFNPKDPIFRFLAKAKLDTAARPQEIVYETPGIDLEDLAPMEFLSSSELQAFEVAANDFYSKALASAERVAPYEKDLRKGFRLPDPDLEPDAYWVYGPPYDRKLLVFWGCEIEQDSSLPLCQTKFTKGPTILDKLREREIPWNAMHAQALDMLSDSNEPLSKFIAKPVTDAKGVLKSVVIGGKTIPASALKTPKFISKKQIDELEEAAMEFYSRAHPNYEGSSPFEKELRRNFRLPDPEKSPVAYMVSNSPLSKGMLVLMDGNEALEDTLSLVQDPELGIPPPSVDEHGNTFVAETICDKLRNRVTPWKKISIAAGALAAVVAISLVLFGVFADTKAPEVESVAAINNPEQVVITFNEPIDKDSLLSDEQKELLKSGAPEPAIKPRRHFTINAESGGKVDIISVARDPADPTKVIVTVPPMKERIRYSIFIENIADASTSKNVMEEPYERSFEFRDEQAPTLQAVSADGSDDRKVMLIFDEALDDVRATLPSCYTIEGFTIIEAEIDETGKKVTVTANNKFENGERYTIGVDGVTDRADRRNPVARGATMEFAYIDTLPPKIESIVAENLQNEVVVNFNEALSPALAQTPGNYIITNAAGESYTALGVNLTSDQKTVTLKVPALENAVNYTLKVVNLQDLAVTPNKIDSTAKPLEFIYTGKPDKEAPIVTKISVRQDGRRITIYFSEAVNRDSAIDPTNYLMDLPLELRVSEVAMRDAENKAVVLSLQNPIKSDATHTMTINNISDEVGNAIEHYVTNSFSLPGMSIQPVDVLGIESTRAATDGMSLQVYFTSGVTAETAQNIAAYKINGDIRVTEITYNPSNPQAIIVNVDKPLQAERYTLTITNLALSSDPSKVQRSLTQSFKGHGYQL